MNGRLFLVCSLIVQRAIKLVWKFVLDRYRLTRRSVSLMWRARLVYGWIVAAILTNLGSALIINYELGPAYLRPVGRVDSLDILVYALVAFGGTVTGCMIAYLLVMILFSRSLLQDPADNAIWTRPSFREQASPARRIALYLNPVGLLIWLVWRIVKRSRSVETVLATA